MGKLNIKEMTQLTPVKEFGGVSIPSFNGKYYRVDLDAYQAHITSVVGEKMKMDGGLSMKFAGFTNNDVTGGTCIAENAEVWYSTQKKMFVFKDGNIFYAEHKKLTSAYNDVSTIRKDKTFLCGNYLYCYDAAEGIAKISSIKVVSSLEAPSADEAASTQLVKETADDLNTRKVEKVLGKDLSDENYTAADKTMLLATNIETKEHLTERFDRIEEVTHPIEDVKLEGTPDAIIYDTKSKRFVYQFGDIYVNNFVNGDYYNETVNGPVRKDKIFLCGSANYIYDETKGLVLNGGGVLQTTGSSRTATMSQKAITDKISFSDDIDSNFVLECYLIGADESKKYRIGTICRGAGAYGWRISVNDIQSGKIVAYATNIKNDEKGVIYIPENEGSGIRGYIVVNWEHFPLGYNGGGHPYLNEKIFNVAYSPNINNFIEKAKTDATITDGIGGLNDKINANATKAEKIIAFNQGNGLPMIDKTSNLETEIHRGYGFTPSIISNFLVDMKLTGDKPTSGVSYKLRLQYGYGELNYSNYLNLIRIEGGVKESIARYELGETPPKGEIIVDMIITKATEVKSAKLLLNYGALPYVKIQEYVLCEFKSYVFDNDYMFNPMIGELYNRTKKSNREISFYRGVGLPMFLKSSVAKDETFRGVTITAYDLSNFLLDMKLEGTPKENVKYRLRVQYLYNGVVYSNAIIFAREENGVRKVLARKDFGENPPKGQTFIDIPAKDEITKFKAIVNFDALPYAEKTPEHQEYIICDFETYDFDLVYLFNPNIGKIAELEKENSKYDIKVIIPDIVYAIEDTELNIWNDTISLSSDRGLLSPLNYITKWECDKGFITDRCFRFTPTINDINKNIICKCDIYDIQKNKLDTKTFTIKVLAKNAIKSAKNIVYCSDSLGRDTANELYKNFEDITRFTGIKPKMCGTRGTTYKYEAVGGYGWKDYATKGRFAYRLQVSNIMSLNIGAKYELVGYPEPFEIREVNINEGVGNILIEYIYGTEAKNFPNTGTLTKKSGGGDTSVTFTGAKQEPNNPMWNADTNRLDIALYKQRIGLQPSEKIDAIAFQFGINDHRLAEDLPQLRTYIKDLYDAFVADNANCKIIVGMMPMSGNDVNGSGANYGATQDWLKSQRDNYLIRKYYLTLQNVPDMPNLVICPACLNIDRFYGYGFAERDISQRYKVKEKYHVNYVHPGVSGYEQLADEYFATFINVLSK